MQNGERPQIVRLIVWNREEAEKRAALLSRAGFEVKFEVPQGPAFLRELRETPPDAIVFDLGRLPSQGRELGLHIRKTAATRRIPLVFVGGEESAVARTRELLPDAVFTSWENIFSSIRHAVAQPPLNPRVPTSVFESYSGTPLPKKLGIKARSVVGLIGAPEDFAGTLGSLPGEVRLRAGAKGRCDILICFVRSVSDLERRMRTTAARADFASMWLVWPKRASGAATDLTQQVVRERGLAAGLVDYKICSIDATGSGLLFARRKEEHGRRRPRDR